MNAQAESYTRLHGRWLLLARLAWAVAFITLTVMYALGFLAVREELSTICEADPCSLRLQIRNTDAGEKTVRWPGPPVGFADRLRPDQVEGLEKLGLSLDQYGWLGALQLGIPALILLLIAAGLFWWKSNDWMVIFASVMVATFAVHNSPLPFTLLVLQPALEWLESLAGLVALTCLLIFPLIFPTGQFVPRWTRWMAIYDVTAAVIVSFLPILEVFGDVLGRVFIGFLVLLPFGLGIYAQLYRYFRVARPAERQQFKWVVFGLAGALVIQVAVLIPLNALLTSPAFSADPARALVLSAIPDTLWQINNLLIAVCIVISVLRYRLWDVDILINRSLVYFTLVAVITGLYVMVVGTLSGLLQNQSELAAPLVAVFIVAALVQPLRRVLQNNVNRLLRFDPGRRDESRVALQKSLEQSDEAQEKHIQLQAISEVDSSTHTRLQGKWLFSARLAWIAIAILAMVIYVAAAPVAFNQLRLGCGLEPCDTSSQITSETANSRQEQVRPSRDLDGWVHTILEATFRLLSLVVALLIFYRRSDDWMAHVASIMLVTIFVVFSPSPMMLANAQPLWRWPIILLRAIALTSTVGLFYLFPDGRFVPRWTRWLAISLLALIGALVAAGAPFWTGLPVFIIALATGAGFQVYRYRWVSTPLQRQQTKWVVLGITGMVLPMLVFFIFGYLNPLLNPLQSNEPILSQGAAVFTMMVIFCVIIPLCFLPVTLAFSILRYRLWDVDLVINRTLVYGALTASVVALYVLIVGWSSIGLQTQNNLAGSVFAILVIAFLFRPLRRCLQRIADRFVPVPETALPAEQHKDKIAIPQGAADTRLRGRWLLIARLAWVILFLTLTVMYTLGFLAVREVLSTVCEEELCRLEQQIRYTEAGEQILGYLGPPIGYADRLRSDQVKVLETLNLTLDQYSWLGALQMGIPLLIYLLIAAGLFWRKSDDWMVLVVSTMIMTFPVAEMPLPYTLALRQPVWQWAYVLAFFVAVSAFHIFPLIFPTGRFVPRWTRWMMFFDLAFAIIVTSLMNSVLGEPGGAGLVLAYLILSLVTNAYAQSYRYFRVANPVERQQIKWVVIGVVGFVIIAFPVDTFFFYHPVIIDSPRALVLSVIPDTIYRAVALFIPVSVAISVLRYRLWDIDIIINRTVVYGALTGIVVSAFVILVGFLSVLFQSSGNSIIAIIATGLVALLFNPLRQRLQRGVNHLMFGERDDPYVALSRLGRRLETTLAPEAVLPTVVTTVRETLKLPYVAIYLQQDSHGYKIVAEAASPSVRMEDGRIHVPGMNREGRCIPLVHQGETLGYIVLGPRAPNEAFSSTDLHLLEDLAPQVGVAVHAVRLAADLQRSREHLVLAREEERRRIRRDLHDGLGPQLAGLALKLETLRNRLKDDPLVDSLLADLAKRTQDATADIRHLVYELRPPTLDELGLVMALREGVTQFTQQGCNDLNITFDAPERLPPLPAAVEVAVYRITQEALTNVIRHADAHTCHVRLSLDVSVGLLCLEVQDDGRGLLMKRRAGVGLNSMRERAEELGGTFTITPIPTGGTRLTAQLPCRVNDRNTSAAPKKE